MSDTTIGLRLKDGEIVRAQPPTSKWHHDAEGKLAVTYEFELPNRHCTVTDTGILIGGFWVWHTIYPVDFLWIRRKWPWSKPVSSKPNTFTVTLTLRMTQVFSPGFSLPYRLVP